MTAGSPRIEDLAAEARYHRQRYELYRAKTYGPRPTTLTRLRELERAHEGAATRLRKAKQEYGRTQASPRSEVPSHGREASTRTQ
jgi:hypothetical protein